MSAANRRPYLGEPVHYCGSDNDCRAAIITAPQDTWGTTNGSALTVLPVGGMPKPARGILHNEKRLHGTWHYAH